MIPTVVTYTDFPSLHKLHLLRSSRHQHRHGRPCHGCHDPWRCGRPVGHGRDGDGDHHQQRRRDGRRGRAVVPDAAGVRTRRAAEAAPRLRQAVAGRWRERHGHVQTAASRPELLGRRPAAVGRASGHVQRERGRELEGYQVDGQLPGFQQRRRHQPRQQHD